METYIKPPETVIAAKTDEKARERFVSENMGLVYSIAKRFFDRGTDREDIIQIGVIGMLKAIDTFRPEMECAFSTYAVPMIMGEIRRYLRDDGQIKVGRRLKQQGAQILRVKEEFVQKNGREPKISELCELMDMRAEELTFALDAALPLRSLEEPIGDEDDMNLGCVLRAEDEIEKSSMRLALREAISKISGEDRAILYYRFIKEYSQEKCAQLLGLTQVKISRREKKIFAKLRGELSG